jgi:hypothetical protein
MLVRGLEVAHGAAKIMVLVSGEIGNALNAPAP